MEALLVTTDLMASSMLEGAARAAGLTLVVAGPGDAARLAGDQTCVTLLDLAAAPADVAGVVASLREAAPGAQLLAYGPHVHRQKLDAARAAGCDRVLTRGELHRDAVGLLRSVAG